MRKVALFVEGQTEYIFIRELLLKWYEYAPQMIGMDCYRLYSYEMQPLLRSYGTKESENYYQIVNVGNDERVLGYLIEHSQIMQEKGFTLIMGLRDMYCKKYRDACQDRTIHPEINQRFIDAANFVIAQSPQADLISMHFAIMEVEAWLLALLHPDEPCDPETSIFCPADEMSRLFATYDKSEGVVESICSRFSREDFVRLNESEKCSSFTQFMDVLFRR